MLRLVPRGAERGHHLIPILIRHSICSRNLRTPNGSLATSMFREVPGTPSPLFPLDTSRTGGFHFRPTVPEPGELHRLSQTRLDDPRRHLNSTNCVPTLTRARDERKAYEGIGRPSNQPSTANVALSSHVSRLVALVSRIHWGDIRRRTALVFPSRRTLLRAKNSNTPFFLLYIPRNCSASRRSNSNPPAEFSKNTVREA